MKSAAPNPDPILATTHSCEPLISSDRYQGGHDAILAILVVTTDWE